MAAPLAKKLRLELRKHDITLGQLAEKAKLPRSAVDNVLYGRSRNANKIKAIAEALDVTADYLLSDEDCADAANNNSEGSYDGRAYRKAMKIVESVLEENDIELNKNIVDEYTQDVYNYLSNEVVQTPRAASAFASGLVHNALKYGKLKRRNS